MLRAVFCCCVIAALVGCNEPSKPAKAGSSWNISSASGDELVPVDGRGLFKISGGVLRGDTSLVAEQSTSQIHIFDGAGKPLLNFGRRGPGPAEFGRLAWIQQSGQRLFAYDGDSKRLSEWTMQGTFRNSIGIVSDQGEQHTPIGVFADSSVLVRSTVFEPRAAVPRVFRPRFILARHDARGQLVDSLLSFHGDESYQEPRPRGGQLSLRRAFGVQTGIAVGARGFALLADDSVVEFRKVDGSLIRRVSLERPEGESRITSDERRSLKSRFLATAVKGRGWEEAYERMPIPERKPTVGWSGAQWMPVVRHLSSGEYWVVRFGGVTSMVISWVVFDEDGQLVRQVEANEEMEILDAYGRSVLVRTWDSEGTERIQVRSLLPPSSTGAKPVS
jgi:hypothetical protein